MQILNYCSISKSEIIKGGKNVFKSEETMLKPFLKEYYKLKKFAYSKFYKMDEQCKLAFITSEVLLEDWNREDYKDEEVAMVFSNSESTLATDMSYWDSTRDIASPALFVYTLPNILMGEIAIRNNFKGENYFFISEKFDTELLHLQTELIFQNTSSKIALVGWVNFENEKTYTANLFLVSRTDEGECSFTIENINKLNK